MLQNMDPKIDRHLFAGVLTNGFLHPKMKLKNMSSVVITVICYAMYYSIGND